MSAAVRSSRLDNGLSNCFPVKKTRHVSYRNDGAIGDVRGRAGCEIHIPLPGIPHDSLSNRLASRPVVLNSCYQNYYHGRVFRYDYVHHCQCITLPLLLLQIDNITQNPVPSYLASRRSKKCSVWVSLTFFGRSVWVPFVTGESFCDMETPL